VIRASQGNDVAFVWFSFSEDSYEQSKKKLFDYYGGASELDLIDLNDLVAREAPPKRCLFHKLAKNQG
jgi:hypothetical protein